MRLLRYESLFTGLEDIEVPIIFMAGPTVRGNQTHLTSWRIAAVEEYERQGFDGILISPEFTVRTETDLGKGWIPRWEFTGLCLSDAIMCWVPRSREMIGLTTNYEHGYWMGRMHEKVVYGRPNDAFRVAYTDVMHHIDAEDRGYEAPPVYTTLSDTVSACIVLARERERAGLRTPTNIRFHHPYTNTDVGGIIGA